MANSTSSGPALFVPPHVERARKLTRRCVMIDLISLITPWRSGSSKTPIVVKFSTNRELRDSRVSEWNMDRWSIDHIELPASEETLIFMTFEEGDVFIVKGIIPSQWLVNYYAPVWRIGRQPPPLEIPVDAPEHEGLALVMRVDEKPFPLATRTHQTLNASIKPSPSNFSSPSVGNLTPTLPRTIPLDLTDAEIHTFLDSYFTPLPPAGHRHVRVLDDGRLVKYGRKVHMHEAIGMQFVRASTSIPVPAIHLAFVNQGITFIVMDEVIGVDLKENLDSPIPDDHLPKLANELVGYIAQIQRLVPPQDPSGGIFGSFPFGPYQNIYFDPPPPRRYRFIEELSMYLISMTNSKPVSPSLLRTGQYVPSVLAHGDLNESNIYVKDGKITGIIDWDTFGSYPPWWDAVQARGVMESKWEKAISNALDAAVRDGRLYPWDLNDPICGAYGGAVDNILWKRDCGQFVGGPPLR